MNRAILRLGVAGALGTALLAGAAAVPAGTSLAPDRPSAPAPGRAQVPVEHAEALCPGADRQGAAGSTAVPQQVTVLAASPPAAVIAAAGGAPGTLRLLPLPAMPGASEGTGRPGGPPGTVTASKAQSVRIAADGAMARGTSGLQLHGEGAGEQRILAATACGPATSESYLVAGGPQPGRQERLVLTNPAPGPVAAEVRVLGTRAGAMPGGPRHVVVPSRGRLVLLLDALSPAEPAAVVQVRAASGTLHTALTDSWLDGVVPRGGDVAAATQAGTDLVIPGVVRGSASARAVLRIAVPGAEEAVVELRAWTPGGQRGLKNAVTRVPGGATADIDISDVPAEATALVVHADVPVVAGAQSTVASNHAAGSDLAWTAAAPPVTRLAGTPLPTALPGMTGEPSASLALSARAATRVTVHQVQADGKVASRTVTVPMTGTVTVPVSGRSAWLVPAGPVHAALLLRAGGADPLLSVVPLADLPVTRVVVPASAD